MLTPSESAALDAWITRCPDDEPCGECSGCGHESTELDADDRCPSCTLDDSALDAILADAPEADRDAAIAGTLCDECGRPMADARGPVCSCCAASWFTPGVFVPRADHEGPRPTVFDVAAMVAA